MNVIHFRITAVLISLILLTTVLTGCRDSGGDDLDVSGGSGDIASEETGGIGGNIGGSNVVDWESTVSFETPELFYNAEFVVFPELPGDARRILNTIIKDDFVYFSTFKGRIFDLSNNRSTVQRNIIESHVLYIDINTMEITLLPDFIPSVPPIEIIEGSMTYATIIRAMHVDNDGNIYIVENVSVNIYDFPENIELSEENFLDYRSSERLYVFIRKLSSTGADLIEPILVPELVDFEFGFAQAINTDIENNIYFAIDLSHSRDELFIFDNNGNLKSSFNSSFNLNNSNGLISLPNGNLVMLTHDNLATYMQEYDAKLIERARSFTLPMSIMDAKVFPGNDDFPVLYTDRTRLLGFNPDTDEIIEIFNLTDSGVNQDNLSAVKILNDGRIMLIIQTWDDDIWDYISEIVYLTKIPFSDLTDRTILTLAALNLDNDTREAIVAFNKSSQTNFIQVIDYSIFDTGGAHGWLVSLDKFSLDITAGKIPDMIAVSPGLPLQRYALTGLFEDLYPFIDDDTELNRENFVEGVLSSSEISGRLYRLFPNFGVLTIIGNPYFVGDTPGWNMDEFQAVLRNNPQADKPLGNWVTSASFLENTFAFYIDQFIDREAGTADFDNARFIQLLESMAFLPYETSGAMDFLGDSELIATGRQIMYMMYLMNIEQYQVYKTVFGDDIVFMGHPTDDRHGNAILAYGGVSMTVTCIDKNGAWEFIRSSLLESWQRKSATNMLPVNKAVFEEMLDKAMISPDIPHDIHFGGFTVPAVPLTQTDADKIRNLIASTTINVIDRDRLLWNIINEEASKFFKGQSSAQDAARIIQNRASIYMSEQFG